MEDTGGSKTGGVFGNTTNNGTLYTDGAGDTFTVSYAANADLTSEVPA